MLFGRTGWQAALGVALVVGALGCTPVPVERDYTRQGESALDAFQRDRCDNDLTDIVRGAPLGCGMEKCVYEIRNPEYAGGYVIGYAGGTDPFATPTAEELCEGAMRRLEAERLGLPMIEEYVGRGWMQGSGWGTCSAEVPAILMRRLDVHSRDAAWQNLRTRRAHVDRHTLADLEGIRVTLARVPIALADFQFGVIGGRVYVTDTEVVREGEPLYEKRRALADAEIQTAIRDVREALDP